MKLITSFLLIITVLSNYGQQKCELIRSKIYSSNEDSIKVRILIETAHCYYEALESDSAEKYYQQALRYLIDLPHSKQTATLRSVALRKLSDIEYDKGHFELAQKYCFQALSSALSQKILTEISACCNNLGIIYHNRGLFDSAAYYYFQSLKIDEHLKDYKGIAIRYNNLGNVYYAQRSLDKAIEFYEKSLNIKKQLKDTSGISFSYLNIGAVWYSRKNFDKALEYFQQSLELKKKLNDANGIILLYNNIGLVYRKQKQYQKALNYYILSLDLAKELNDKQKIAMLYENISNVYYNMGMDEKDKIKAKQHYLKAIENCLQAYAISKEIKSLEFMYSSVSSIYRIYFALSEFQEGIKYLEIFLNLKDSLFNNSKLKAIAEAEKKFEAEKKQLVIDNLTKEKELQASELKRQETIIWSVLIVLGLSIIFAIVIVQRFRVTRRQKQIIEKQKAIVDEKNRLLNKQNEEIKAQHEIVIRQKEQIEEMHKKLTDSINYAKRIQEAILPDKETTNQLLGNYFILFKPKDIVSGDFYWTTRINEWLIIAVADCTGHGVPGAFMSMLGVSFLNEIVHKKEVTKASQVLHLLREEIIHALRQKCINVEQKDGMDISFFVMNTNTRECQWAGANNSLIILQKVDNENQWQLAEIKPDKMPLAIYPRLDPFTNHEFIIEKETRIYLFSDGFADQFGHVNGKKYMHKRFKQLLLDTAHLPLSNQKQVLNQTIEEWKGHLEQTDDITIVAVEF
ncbi:MAG: tetratricopeptide repeat protein [Bacteroidales bacterium]|nr:tetratricopeptide repeat protein [Bacteroidales bacterium]